MKLTTTLPVAFLIIGSGFSVGSRLRVDRTVEPNLSPVSKPNARPVSPLSCDSQDKLSAGNVTAPFARLTQNGYAIRTRYRTAKLDVPSEYGPPPRPVKVSYAVVSHRGRPLARFDGNIFFPLGNSTQAGWFALLRNGTRQLIVSQDTPRTGVQWAADFSRGFRIIFDGQKFNVGREVDDMRFADLDQDGRSEILVPITAFYGFEHWRLTTGATPLPQIVFKYDPGKREYRPANPAFKKCLVREPQAARDYLDSLNPQTDLGPLMAVILDHIFAGDEELAWQMFEDVYDLPDKATVKADMLKEIRAHPVYAYLRRAAVDRPSSK